MQPARDKEITVLLNRWGDGNRDALGRLLPLVYGQLRKIAASQLKRESGVTLQATELVHELYLRIQHQGHKEWESRDQFYAVCTRVLRFLLTDHARKRLRNRRGGGKRPLSLDGMDLPVRRDIDLVRLDDALKTLEQLDPRKARVVELRFYGGFDLEEIASLLEISPSTIKRDWVTARAWLQQEVSP